MTVPSRSAPIDMAVDTSAIIAILLAEPMRATVHRELGRSAGSVISAANLLECNLVAESRLGEDGSALVDDLLRTTDTVVMPIEGTLTEGALDAWRRFGHGNHAAKLNYGDCFSYALAAHLDVPLLCVGDDFAQTDLTVVPARTN